MVTLRRRAEWIATPWKNGAGITHELARAPQSDGDSFDWRVSVARLTAHSRFSPFPSMQRLFTLLEGSIELTIDGAPLVPHRREPVPFSGDIAVSCRILAEALAFNVIFDPRRVACEVTPLAEGRTATNASLLFALESQTVTTESEQMLNVYDALLFSEPANVTIVRGAALVMVHSRTLLA